MSRRDRPVCRWTEDEDGCWDTDCGNKFILNDGTPRDNKMRFCCYCGWTLKVRETEQP